MKYLLTLILALSLINCKSPVEGETRVIDRTEFDQMTRSQDATILDVRTPEEYAGGYIKNAINIDVLEEDNFRSKVDSLDRSEPVYLYCRSGKRSAAASEILKEMGFKKIYDLENGYSGWIE